MNCLSDFREVPKMVALAFLLFMVELMVMIMPYVLAALGVLMVIGLIVRRRGNK